MAKIHLRVITPHGVYFKGDVDYLEVRGEHSVLGILPNHTPLISALIIAPMKIKMGNNTFIYAAGEGVVNVKKEETVLLLNSIERLDEIDIARALDAKKRAESRLNNKDKEVTDIARAEAALARAMNRINIYNTYKN